MKLFVLALAGLVSLVGCSTFEKVEQRQLTIVQTMDQTSKQVEAVRNQASNPSRDTVRYMDAQWVTLKPTIFKEKVVVPELRCKIKLQTSEPVSIFEFSQIVTKYCGISVRVTPDAISAIENPTMGSSVASSPTTPGMPTAQPLSQQGNSDTTKKNLIDINYSNGELTGLLDMVTARFGVLWKFEDGKVKIYNVDTETFFLQTLAGSTDMSSVIQSGTTMVSGASGGSGSGGGAGAGSGGGSSGGVSGNSGTNQTTTISLKTSIWDDIKLAIESMKSAKGAVAMSPATGSITVTDNADVLSHVRDYVKKQNESLTKQVLFNIKVISVATNNSDNFGISWQAVYQTVAGKYGLKLSSGTGLIDGATQANFSILNSSGSPYAGTSAILSALAEQGGVTVLREPSASTLNLQPVSLQVARQDGFLAGTSNVSTAQVGNTTTIQTGIVTTGFNMSLLPYVLEDNRMLLQFSINLSNLRNMRTVSSNGATAEVPEVDLPINSTQKVRLRPGETLVLSGFDQMDETANKSGVGSPNNLLLGGTVRGSTKKSTLVVLITPVIME